MQLYVRKCSTLQMANDANDNNYVYININQNIISTEWKNYTIKKTDTIQKNYIALSAQQRKDNGIFLKTLLEIP